MGELLVTYILSFAIYCSLGWLFESILCSVSEHRFVNRGFLNGPICPIYGAGAMSAVLLLGDLQSNLEIFALGALVSSVIEYATSWTMELLYHARWWDYSDRFLNLNGRVCVPATALFGGFSLLVARVLQPAINDLLASMPSVALNVLRVVFLGVFVLDIVVTNIGLSGFRNKIDAYCDELTVRFQGAIDTLTEGDNVVAQNYQRLQQSPLGKASVRIRELLPGPVAIEDIGRDLAESFNEALNAQERRVLDAFPRMRVKAPSLESVRELATNARDAIRRL